MLVLTPQILCIFLPLIYFILFLLETGYNILSNKNQGKDVFIVSFNINLARN